MAESHACVTELGGQPCEAYSESSYCSLKDKKFSVPCQVQSFSQRTNRMGVSREPKHRPDIQHETEYRPFKYSLSFSFSSADLFLLLSQTTC